MFNETFWLACSIVFFFLLIFKQLKTGINSILVKRIQNIEDKFKEIETIAQEAENLLIEYTQLKETSKSKAQEIIKNAELEVKHLKKNAEQDLSYKLKLKTENMQHKINNLETKALSELRLTALNLAISSSVFILKNNDREISQEIIKKSLQEISTHLY